MGTRATVKMRHRLQVCFLKYAQLINNYTHFSDWSQGVFAEERDKFEWRDTSGLKIVCIISIIVHSEYKLFQFVIVEFVCTLALQI